MRNPFPKIGKVIKYDLKHSSKRLIPLYGVLLLLGLLAGLFISPSQREAFYGSSSSAYTMGSRDFITISLFMAYLVVSIVAFVMTIVAIARRFKQSMLEEEAYMNLSLPVTMGEHLWGKFITGFIWMFACCLVTFVSELFCLIRLDLPKILKTIFEELPNLSAELAQYNLSIAKIFWLGVMVSVAATCFIITLIFVVNSFGLVIKSRRSFWKVLIIVGLFYINGWIFRLVPGINTYAIPDFAVGAAMFKSLGIFSLILVLISAVYFAVTQYMFTKQLNLD
ncbi:MAG: hypothetical protein J5726_07895 [Treponema sp.]|nr:hypothetical protein [Treponema sp.]